MRSLGLVTFLLFSLSVFAFSIDGPNGKIVTLGELSNPSVIGVITFDGESGSGGAILINNVGLMPSSNSFIEKIAPERKIYLDTVVRFEHLTKYAHFLNRERCGNKFLSIS